MITEDFESLLTANQHRIYHYLWNLLNSETDAQDVLQDVFIAFYEHLDTIDKSSAVSYLYRIAHNKALTYIKQRKRFTNLPPEAFAQMPEPNNSGAEVDYSALRIAIQELPVKLSTVIHLQYYDKLSYKQIAEQLGLSLKAVETLIVRAKRLLRKKLMQDSAR